jgi:hypothetical protein
MAIETYIAMKSSCLVSIEMRTSGDVTWYTTLERKVTAVAAAAAVAQAKAVEER